MVVEKFIQTLYHTTTISLPQLNIIIWTEGMARMLLQVFINRVCYKASTDEITNDCSSHDGQLHWPYRDIRATTVAQRFPSWIRWNWLDKMHKTSIRRPVNLICLVCWAFQEAIWRRMHKAVHTGIWGNSEMGVEPIFSLVNHLAGRSTSDFKSAMHAALTH